MRLCLFLAAWTCLLAMSCGDDGRTRCNGGDDHNTCGSGASCLWLHLGTGKATPSPIARTSSGRPLTRP